MDPTAIATIIVALVASVSAYLAQRESSKANSRIMQMEVNSKKETADTKSRVEMEREAYVRARKFDTDTIKRQEDELRDLRKRVEELETEVDSLRAQLRGRP